MNDEFLKRFIINIIRSVQKKDQKSHNLLQDTSRLKKLITICTWKKVTENSRKYQKVDENKWK